MKATLASNRAKVRAIRKKHGVNVLAPLPLASRLHLKKYGTLPPRNPYGREVVSV